jgi:hypothetical protein
MKFNIFIGINRSDNIYEYTKIVTHTNGSCKDKAIQYNIRKTWTKLRWTEIAPRLQYHHKTRRESEKLELSTNTVAFFSTKDKIFILWWELTVEIYNVIIFIFQ